MMNRFAPLLVVAAAACSGPARNPSTIYLAPNGSEVVVHLVAEEPGPY
jgi:hypothetical protein